VFESEGLLHSLGEHLQQQRDKEVGVQTLPACLIAC
jgi:hypothetical protein